MKATTFWTVLSLIALNAIPHTGAFGGPVLPWGMYPRVVMDPLGALRFEYEYQAGTVRKEKVFDLEDGQLLRLTTYNWPQTIDVNGQMVEMVDQGSTITIFWGDGEYTVIDRDTPTLLLIDDDQGLPPIAVGWTGSTWFDYNTQTTFPPYNPDAWDRDKCYNVTIDIGLPTWQKKLDGGPNSTEYGWFPTFPTPDTSLAGEVCGEGIRIKTWTFQSGLVYWDYWWSQYVGKFKGRMALERVAEIMCTPGGETHGEYEGTERTRYHFTHNIGLSSGLGVDMGVTAEDERESETRRLLQHSVSCCRKTLADGTLIQTCHQKVYREVWRVTLRYSKFCDPPKIVYRGAVTRIIRPWAFHIATTCDKCDCEVQR